MLSALSARISRAALCAALFICALALLLPAGLRTGSVFAANSDAALLAAAGSGDAALVRRLLAGA
jgi:hypothetical protein